MITRARSWHRVSLAPCSPRAMSERTCSPRATTPIHTARHRGMAPTDRGGLPRTLSTLPTNVNPNLPAENSAKIRIMRRIHMTHMTHRWCASCSPDSGSSAICQLCMVYASDCMIMQVVRITRNTHGAQHGGAWGGTHVYRCGTQITCSRGTIFLVLGDTETVLCRLSPPPT